MNFTKAKANLLLAVILSGSIFSTANAASPTDERWQAFNEAAVSEHIAPYYQRLADSSESLSKGITAYCEAPSDANFATAQKRFKTALQSWQGIQHIQFGPVTLLMRNFSLQYWPDKKNLGSKQLNLMLKENQQSSLADFDDEFFARASVAVKGYPALERMLFDKKKLAQMQSMDSYCPVMSAISQHVAQNTRSIVNEWQQELNNYQNYEEDAVYESSKEAATEILKALVEPIEAISDGKIAAPLGKSLQKMRWRKSESWRSQQSVENIRSNIKTLQHLYSGVSKNSTKQLLIESGDSALAEKIEAQFSLVLSLLDKVNEPQNMQYDATQYAQLVEVQVQLKTLSNDLLASMKPLDIQLGFNRRDGD